MGKKRGQISFEYIVLVGTILVLIIPLFYYVTYESSQDIKVSQADDAVKGIARAADTVYALGPGAKNYVWITLPGGIQTTSVGNKEIVITLSLYGGMSDIVSTTVANVTGVIPTEKGTFKVPVEMLDSGVVQIG